MTRALFIAWAVAAAGLTAAMQIEAAWTRANAAAVEARE